MPLPTSDFTHHAQDIASFSYIISMHTHNTDDIAVDWISNKLYWTDALSEEIRVMDLERREVKSLLRTEDPGNNNSIPRGIAVDPIAQYVYTHTSKL